MCIDKCIWFWLSTIRFLFYFFLKKHMYHSYCHQYLGQYRNPLFLCRGQFLMMEFSRMHCTSSFRYMLNPLSYCLLSFYCSCSSRACICNLFLSCMHLIAQLHQNIQNILDCQHTICNILLCLFEYFIYSSLTMPLMICLFFILTFYVHFIVKASLDLNFTVG